MPRAGCKPGRCDGPFLVPGQATILIDEFD
jgi:hypothetical protein